MNMRGTRLNFLDGIRGFMAVNVVLAHFLMLFFPVAGIFQTAGFPAGWAYQADLLFGRLFVNGEGAVQYFFVLTGFLMARSCLPGRVWQQQDLLRKSVNRYLRLLPMVAGATVFVYLTMVLNLQYHRQIADQLPMPDMVRIHNDFTPTIPFLIRSIFYMPFMEISPFVNPFWTIRYEFWGYLLCMLACYVLQGSKLRRLGFVVVMVLLWMQIDEYYVGFFLGVLTADLCFCPEADATVLSRFYGKLLNRKAVAWLLLIPGLWLAYFDLHEHLPVLSRVTGKALGISILLFCMMKLPVLTRPFSWKPMQLLGKYSFGIYAFHWPLMLSVEAKLFDLLSGAMSYVGAACVSLLLTLPVILVVGWGAYWLLEEKCRLDAGVLLKKL